MLFHGGSLPKIRSFLGKVHPTLFFDMDRSYPQKKKLRVPPFFPLGQVCNIKKALLGSALNINKIFVFTYSPRNSRQLSPNGSH